ncbi:MAG TPA: hypothetical protein VJQ83_04190 [Tepidiformaceae bacterium]|nr:hypothetical protein [Tepidiformaceae bacterium]
MANLGHTIGAAKVWSALNVFGQEKQPTSVDMHPVTGQEGTPLAFVSLIRNGVLNMRSRADATGMWHFYDMDDSGNQAYTIIAYTQAGATGEAWTATVSGSTATVTKIFAAQRAVAAAFT